MATTRGAIDVPGSHGAGPGRSPTSRTPSVALNLDMHSQQPRVHHSGEPRGGAQQPAWLTTWLRRYHTQPVDLHGARPKLNMPDIMRQLSQRARSQPVRNELQNAPAPANSLGTEPVLSDSTQPVPAVKVSSDIAKAPLVAPLAKPPSVLSHRIELSPTSGTVHCYLENFCRLLRNSGKLEKAQNS